MAIGDGTDAIRLGRADVMFCGGTEAAINKVGIAGFGAMRALSRRNDDPTGGVMGSAHWSRPPYPVGQDGSATETRSSTTSLQSGVTIRLGAS